jgi:predicted metal-dependent hydrolase
VLLPAGMSLQEEERWVEQMQARMDRRRRGESDDELLQRAQLLSRRYFDGGLQPSSVRWSTTQATRWGSCTIDTASIRISSRMRDFPRWVIDYVLVHELCHLRYRGHGPRFWGLANRYPLTERARGFLIAKGGDVDGVD